MTEIICDTRAELDLEITRVCDRINSLIIGEKFKSGYILYSCINGGSLESIFQHQVSVIHRNPSKVAFEWKSFSPCDINRCLSTCGWCREQVGHCDCSWGREYMQWTFWIASPEEIEFDQNEDNADINNINKGIL